MNRELNRWVKESIIECTIVIWENAYKQDLTTVIGDNAHKQDLTTVTNSFRINKY